MRKIRSWSFTRWNGSPGVGRILTAHAKCDVIARSAALGVCRHAGVISGQTAGHALQGQRVVGQDDASCDIMMEFVSLLKEWTSESEKEVEKESEVIKEGIVIGFAGRDTRTHHKRGSIHRHTPRTLKRQQARTSDEAESQGKTITYTYTLLFSALERFCAPFHRLEVVIEGEKFTQPQTRPIPRGRILGRNWIIYPDRF